MANFHLAQINVARMRAALTDPIMKGFVDQLDEVNALAEASPGFVWRLKTEAGNATDVQAFDDPMILVNMSVWESVEALQQYVYRSHHVNVFRDRGQWFETYGAPHLALWWIPAGKTPTVEEGKRRLELLKARGPTGEAFTFKQVFAMVAGS